MADTLTTEMIVKAVAEGFDKVHGELNKTATAGTQAEKGINVLGMSMSQVGAIAGGVFVGGVAAAGAALVSSINAAAEAEQVQARLGAQIQASGRAAETSVPELYELAGSLAEVSTFGDDAIATGLGILTTFQQVSEETRNNAAPLMVDMATAFGSVDTAAEKLGAALNDFDGFTKVARQIGGFTAEQEAAFAQFEENNDLIGYQNALLDILAQKFGGQAAAAAATFSGRMAQLKDRIGEAQEEIGGAFLPALTTLAEEAIPALQEAAAELVPVIQDLAAEELPALVDSAKEVIGALPEVVSTLIEVGDAVEDLQKLSPQYWFSQLGKAAIEAAGDLDVNEGRAQNIITTYGMYGNAIETATFALEGHTRSIVAEGSAYDYLIPKVEAVNTSTQALTGAYDSMIQTSIINENRMEHYGQRLGEAEQASYSLATAADSINQRLAAQHEQLTSNNQSFAGYFNEARTATGETSNWNMVLLEAAERAGANAYQLGILAAATGEYTQAEIENILETAAMTAKAEELGQALASGEINTRQAIAALQDFKAALDATEGTYNVEVHTNYTSSGMPPGVGPGSQNPNNPDYPSPDFMGGSGGGPFGGGKGITNNFNLTLNGAMFGQNLLSQFALMRGMMGA